MMAERAPELQSKIRPRRPSSVLLLALRRSALLVGVCARELGPLLLRRLLGRPVEITDLAVRVRRVLERMGLTYVKLGQFMATRYDLLPRAVSDELGRLFQRAEPMPLAEVVAQIEAGLGQPVAKVFPCLDPQPLGSASVAQVHRAQRADGDWVAVKVQRLGVRRAFEADMRSLGVLVRLATALRLEIGFDLPAAAAEFSAYTARELDFRVEAATAEQVRAQGDATILIPRVHEDLSCDTVLTLELIHGVSLSELYAALDRGEPAAPGLSEAAEILAQAIFRQLFVAGFFHGDPHPGNIMLTQDGRVALIDFGIFGELDPRQLADVRGYIEQLATGNAARAYDFYARMLTLNRWSDLEGFRGDAIATLQDWQAAAVDPDAPKAETMISTVADRLLTVLRRHHVALRLDTLLFWRAVILLDANFARPELNFELNDALRRFFAGQEAASARRIAAALMRPQALQALIDLRLQGPRQARGLLARQTPVRVSRSAAPQVSEPVTWILGGLLSVAVCFLAAAILGR